MAVNMMATSAIQDGSRCVPRGFAGRPAVRARNADRLQQDEAVNDQVF